MCYMDGHGERVGVRELRHNISVYLRRVENGETFHVTDRGRTVAVLAPLAAGSTALERLTAAGRATTPLGDLRDLGPPLGARSSRRVSRTLAAMRAERL
jgi:prevent-host-death family protein